MRIQTGMLLLALAGAALASNAQTPHDNDGDPVTMIADADGRAYRVEPGETLGEAMAKAALVQNAEEKEQGVCVQEDLVHKPEGAVACTCYEHTQCEGETESRECKRHCRKDLCKCCSI